MLDAGQVNTFVEVGRNSGNNECLSPCIRHNVFNLSYLKRRGLS
jgi:hypothetical protein